MFKTITPPLVRVVVLLGLFLVISGLAGPRIISGGILFRDGFAWYGGLGKATIFGLIAFVLLVRHRKDKVTLKPWHVGLLGWMVASCLAFAASWVAVDHLLADQRQLPNLMLAHIGLILSVIFAGLACLGPKNIQAIWQKYWRELVIAVGLAGAFYYFLLIVYMLWRPLASVVLVCVNGLLGASGLHGILVPPHTLLFDKFGITVAEYCSGIESIALFTGLYVIVGLLDWQHLNKTRYFLVFPLALLGLCVLNIVRVYGLIMAGYYINPEIAFSLFHTYAGMVFFILYSAAFWAVAYRYLINRKEAPDNEKNKPS